MPKRKTIASLIFLSLILCACRKAPSKGESNTEDLSSQIENTKIERLCRAVHSELDGQNTEKARRLLYQTVLPEFERIEHNSKPQSSERFFAESSVYTLMSRVENYLESENKLGEAEAVERSMIELSLKYQRDDALDQNLSSKIDLVRLLIKENKYIESEALMKETVHKARLANNKYGYYNLYLCENLKHFSNWYKKQGRDQEAAECETQRKFAEDRARPESHQNLAILIIRRMLPEMEH